MASGVSGSSDIQRLEDIVQSVKGKISTLDEKISNVWKEIFQNRVTIWVSIQGVDCILLQERMNKIDYDTLEAEIEKAIIEQKPVQDQVVLIHKVFQRVLPSMASSSSSSPSSTTSAPDFNLALYQQEYRIQCESQINGQSHTLEIGPFYNPQDKATEEELLLKMNSAIKEGMQHFRRMSQRGGGSFRGDFPDSYMDPDFLLALELSRQTSPVRTPALPVVKQGMNESLIELMQMVRFEVNELFEEHNPYSEPAEMILPRFDIQIEPSRTIDSFKVTYGKGTTDTIYWLVNVTKPNGESMTQADYTQRLFEIFYFGPALHEHLHFWCGKGIFLSTDFADVNGTRKFTMGIHRIGNLAVCSLLKMSKETVNEWKTYIDLPSDVCAIKPAEVFGPINSFIWHKLSEHLHPIINQYLSFIYDSMYNQNTPVILSIEQDLGCKVHWQVANQGLALIVEFEKSETLPQKLAAYQRILNFLPLDAATNKIELKATKLTNGKQMPFITCNTDMDSGIALILQDLIGFCRMHFDKGVLTEYYCIAPKTMHAIFAVFNVEEIDAMTIALSELFSNFPQIEYEVKQLDTAITIEFKLRPTALLTS